MKDIYVYGVIGPRSEDPEYIDADYIRELLDRAGSQPVNIRINSPGGTVSEGVAIYNMLRRHRYPVHTTVDSLAASIASIIMLAGEKRTMATGSDVMIHSPWTITVGDKIDHTKAVGALTVTEDSLIDIYSSRTGKIKGQLRKWLEDETWFSPKQALENGFATHVE